MEFKYESQEVIDKMTDAEVDAYTVAKRAYELSLTDKSIAEKITPIQGEVETIKESLQSEVDRVNKQLEEMGEQLNTLKEKTIKGNGMENNFKNEYDANKGKLASIAKKSTNEEVVMKTLVQRSAIASNTQVTWLSEIGQLAHRKLTMYDIFPKITLSESNNNGVIKYSDWDELTTVRAAAAVAEGAAFPESTATWKQFSLPLCKIGDTLPVTEEFFEDEAMFAAELQFFLETNVALEIDRQLLLGNGASNTMTGLVASIPSFTGASAGVSAATIYDLIVKTSEQITFSGGSKYTPDFALMNIADINKMRLSKDTHGNYIMPPFANADGSMVAGITIIESNIVTANTMVVGDRKYAKIYEKTGLVISQGMINAQFTEDEMTLKARKRMLFLIRNCDSKGFRYIPSISAAVLALA